MRSNDRRAAHDDDDDDDDDQKHIESAWLNNTHHILRSAPAAATTEDARRVDLAATADADRAPRATGRDAVVIVIIRDIIAVCSLVV